MTKPREIRLDDVLALVPEAPASGRELVRHAYALASEAHSGQERKSGGPYIQHPLHVAYLLAELNLKPAVVAAGLLHDVLEDTEITPEELRERFGEEVMRLVEGVTKLQGMQERVDSIGEGDGGARRDQQDLETLRKMFIAVAEDDLRIIFVKLADRLHNMRTLDSLEPEAQQRMAQETLEIFAPLVNRLGIWYWKAEFEDLAFRYLNPTMYSKLARLLDARKVERQARVERHVNLLRRALEREEVPAQIKGRPKHIYSIYGKMLRKELPFSEIYDVEGLRVIVDTKDQCYYVLGIVHELWTPVPGEFDDYIAKPKPNRYQSLHTAVIGEDGKALEIQIRTHAMDEIAERGVAAHWQYKEQDARVSEETAHYFDWMRQRVQELTQEGSDAQTFVDTMRSDLFQDRVYVFTPKGNVIDLPLGATPIDFAYKVHTEVGHRCRGARVNKRWVPLDYRLKTGDQVEIITGRADNPSRDWLNEELGFVKTGRAQQKIKQWFRRQSFEENQVRGQGLITQELKRLGIDMTMEEVAELFEKHYPRPRDFYAAVGMGDVSSERLVNRIESDMRRREEEEQEFPDAEEQPLPPPPTMEGKVTIQGAGGLLTRIAGCCKPIPGQEIIGYVTRGRGVTIHKRDCATLLRLEREERERLIELEWGAQEQTFPVQTVITVYPRPRLLHDISEVIADEDLNIASVKSGKRDRYNIMPIYITLEVPNLQRLNRVLGRIERVSNVVSAQRVV
jgi:GTP pyrophosphokinase